MRSVPERNDWRIDLSSNLADWQRPVCTSCGEALDDRKNRIDTQNSEDKFISFCWRCWWIALLI
jgi:RNase P subunit RPR2